jgi:hypothetical protein
MHPTRVPALPRQGEQQASVRRAQIARRATGSGCCPKAPRPVRPVSPGASARTGSCMSDGSSATGPVVGSTSEWRDPPGPRCTGPAVNMVAKAKLLISSCTWWAGARLSAAVEMARQETPRRPGVRRHVHALRASVRPETGAPGDSARGVCRVARSPTLAT